MRIMVAGAARESAERLEAVIRARSPEAQCCLCVGTEQAEKAAEELRCDVFFLHMEAETPSMLRLARWIRERFPTANLVLVDREYRNMKETMELRVSGYLTEPITPEKVGRELEELRYPPEEETEALLVVHCVGNFDVFLPDRTRLRFTRSKSKEVFAYLVHRWGAACTVREIAAVLFEDAPYDLQQQRYMQKILSALMQTLRSVGAEGAVQKSYNSIALNTETVKSDLHGGAPRESVPRGEYMAQYSWAEFAWKR